MASEWWYRRTHEGAAWRRAGWPTVSGLAYVIVRTDLSPATAIAWTDDPALARQAREELCQTWPRRTYRVLECRLGAAADPGIGQSPARA